MNSNRRKSPYTNAALILLTAVILVCFVGYLVLREQNVGYQGLGYDADGVTAPTAEKPQSKLWFEGGVWWGSLFDVGAGEHRIFSLESEVWSDTGTLIDARNAARTDVLWSGEHLYVATATSSESDTDQNIYIRRYSYDSDAARYTLDEGFPVAAGSGVVEAVVLDLDSSGKLWITYTLDERVYVNHSLEDDGSWNEPYILPVEGTSIEEDDISSVIAYGSRVGVMWSNQVENTMYFATHRNGDPDDEWDVSVAARGIGLVDDHISLASDSRGRVYAATKTSLDDATNPDSEAPLIRLLTLGTDDRWRAGVFGTVSDGHTRPIVKVDKSNQKLYVVATAPVDGGGIYYKQAALANKVSFPEGLGKPLIRRGSDALISIGPDILVNNATSAKQRLGSEDGLLIITSDEATKTYFHNYIDIE